MSFWNFGFQFRDSRFSLPTREYHPQFSLSNSLGNTRKLCPQSINRTAKLQSANPQEVSRIHRHETRKRDKGEKGLPYQCELSNDSEMTPVATPLRSIFAVSDLIPNTSDGPD